MKEYVGFYTEIARRMGIECQSIELENCMQRTMGQSVWHIRRLFARAIWLSPVTL